jgi:hypothetical protein
LVIGIAGDFFSADQGHRHTHWRSDVASNRDLDHKGFGDLT